MNRRGTARGWTARVLALVAAAAMTTGPLPASANDDAQVVRNGGFETGTLSGWQTSEQGNRGDGWSADTGARSPVSGFTIPAPPQGRWQAVSDQTGPGSHVLYQDIAVEDDEQGLALTLWYRNRAGRFITPPSLNPFSRANQQLRVDLMRPGAPVRSMAGGDILATIFRTRVGDPNRMEPTTFRQDLSGFEGGTVRLRIAEVDNQFFFQAGVDAVHVMEIDDDSGGWSRSDADTSGARAAAPNAPWSEPGTRYAAR